MLTIQQVSCISSLSENVAHVMLQLDGCLYFTMTFLCLYKSVCVALLHDDHNSSNSKSDYQLPGPSALERRNIGAIPPCELE